MGPEALGAELGWWPRRGRDRRIQGRSEPMGSTVSGVERGGTDSRRQEAQQLTFPGGSLCQAPSWDPYKHHPLAPTAAPGGQVQVP